MKKLLLAIGLWIATATGAMCQGTLPIALTQQVNINGQPLAGALLYTYVQGTVATPQTTYADSGLTVANPWPLQADQTGRLPMFYMATGSVHARLTDSTGLQVFDYPNMLVIGAAGGGGGGAAVDPTSVLATGDLKVKYGTGSLSGFVRANGLTIGSAVSGATERANADTQNLFVYLYNADPNLVVSGGRTSNALNDFNANKTITLPDWRGRAIAALGDMGNAATSVLTATFAGCNNGVTTLGSACGSQSQTLGTSNLPPYTPAGTITNGAITVTSNQQGVNSGATTLNNQASGTVGTFSQTLTATQAASTFTGNAQGGTSTPFSQIQPIMLATIYIKL